MRLSSALLPALLILLALPALAPAAESGRKLNPQTGTIQVGNKLATIAVPEGMFFLAKADARYLLEQVWQNPPDDSVLGLVVKPGPGEDDPDRVVVVSYDGDGHVDDGDARKIDYDDLLEDMQDASKDASAEMVKRGYRSEELLGWAEPPHYDSAEHKLYWAKSIRFGGEPEPSLNYCIRILGRTGVLELNALGATAELEQVAPVAQAVMASTAFQPGNRYEEYVEGSDLAQAGGIAGLIAGGLVAKKLGLFAIIGVTLLKFGKILIIPLILVGTWAFSWFRRRREARAQG